jgi:Na+:H+ antiporter
VSAFQLAAVVITLTAALAYINARVLRLPASVGLMAIAMFGSVTLLVLDATNVVDLSPRVRDLVGDLDFGNTLLHGMLGLLLFAGALHIDVTELGQHRLAVAVLALGSTLISTVAVGFATYFVLDAIGVHVELIHAFLFGALISPTDPIAVLGMLKSAGAPPELDVRIAGESLFNDGVAVVIFSVVLSIAGGQSATASDVAILFARESLGGALFGLATGYVTVRFLRTIDDYSVEVLITLALVVGGYAFAEAIHVSAPIAAVCAGLVIGNQGRTAMSDQSRTHVDLFWKLIDEILNAVLFLMIGLVIVLVPISSELAGAMAVAVPIALASRLVSIALPMQLLRPLRASTPHSTMILTWGGLRGGLSIAMALSLPASGAHDAIIVMTYAVVAWTILVQGTTFPRLLRRLGVTERSG